MGEIAASSQEQSQGIGQVSKAVGEMDKVTQANAAGAEESASAAEQLSSQAEMMRQSVAELVAVTGADGGDGGRADSAGAGPARAVEAGGQADGEDPDSSKGQGGAVHPTGYE